MTKATADLAGEHLTRIHGTRNAMDQVVWTVASLFVAAMAVLLSKVIDELKSEHVGAAVALSIAGLFLSVVWKLTMERVLLWLEFHEQLIGQLEILCELPDNLSATPRNPLCGEVVVDGPRAKGLLRMLASVAAFW
jgi:hypothetical protein